MKRKLVLQIALTFTSSFSIIGVFYFHSGIGCYIPRITSIISKTEVNINENITITGQIYPTELNKTLRRVFVKPEVEKLVGIIEI